MLVVPSVVCKLLPRRNRTCGGPQSFFLRSRLSCLDFPINSQLTPNYDN
uniref:Uncharacterized protein n=1 Tax=Anguilla anguilla TaxID=7936 RepID=A0A0E9XY53_ANGAN